MPEHVKEARHVPGLGAVLFGGAADELPQPVVAAQVGQAGFDAGVAQQDGQQEHAPEDVHGIVITTFATMFTQFGEQAAIGHGVEKLADGGEVGAVIQTIPGEERFGDRDVHEGPPAGGRTPGQLREVFYKATNPRIGGGVV